jgi:hypothetical protein
VWLLAVHYGAGRGHRHSQIVARRDEVIRDTYRSILAMSQRDNVSANTVKCCVDCMGLIVTGATSPPSHPSACARYSLA